MASIEIEGDNLLFEGQVVGVITAPESSFRSRFIDKLRYYVREAEPVTPKKDRFHKVDS